MGLSSFSIINVVFNRPSRKCPFFVLPYRGFFILTPKDKPNSRHLKQKDRRNAPHKTLMLGFMTKQLTPAINSRTGPQRGDCKEKPLRDSPHPVFGLVFIHRHCHKANYI